MADKDQGKNFGGKTGGFYLKRTDGASTQKISKAEGANLNETYGRTYISCPQVCQRLPQKNCPYGVLQSKHGRNSGEIQENLRNSPSVMVLIPTLY